MASFTLVPLSVSGPPSMEILDTALPIFIYSLLLPGTHIEEAGPGQIGEAATPGHSGGIPPTTPGFASASGSPCRAPSPL